MNVYCVSDECYSSKIDLEPRDQLNVGPVFMNLEDAKTYVEDALTEYDVEVDPSIYEWTAWKDNTWEYAPIEWDGDLFLFRVTEAKVQ